MNDVKDASPSVTQTVNVKRGLDRYTELIWRLFFDKEFADIAGKTVVDMGCGDGRYTSGLVGKNTYHGVDCSCNARAATITSFVESIPLPDGCADEVIAIGILDYSDPDATIKEAHRLLKEDGNLRVMVPNSMCPYHLIRVLLDFRGYKKTFVWGELLELVNSNGFKMVGDHEDGFCFYVPGAWLQELMIPVYMALNGFLGSMLGNNMYIKAVKKPMTI
jgi:SAM-dependent methyltransferase